MDNLQEKREEAVEILSQDFILDDEVVDFLDADIIDFIIEL